MTSHRLIVKQLTAVLIMEPTYIANYVITGGRLVSQLTGLVIYLVCLSSPSGYAFIFFPMPCFAGQSSGFLSQDFDRNSRGDRPAPVIKVEISFPSNQVPRILSSPEDCPVFLSEAYSLYTWYMVSSHFVIFALFSPCFLVVTRILSVF